MIAVMASTTNHLFPFNRIQELERQPGALTIEQSAFPEGSQSTTDTTYNKMFSTVVDCESVLVLFTILAQEWWWIVIDDVQCTTVTSSLQRSSTAALKKHHNRNHLITTLCNLNGKVDPSELSSLRILEYNQWLCKSKWSWKGWYRSWFRRTARGKASSRNTSLEQKLCTSSDLKLLNPNLRSDSQSRERWKTRAEKAHWGFNYELLPSISKIYSRLQTDDGNDGNDGGKQQQQQ